MELRVLFDYSNWILATENAAIAADHGEGGDRGRDAYYQGLLEALKVDYCSAVKELEPLHRRFYPEVWERRDCNAVNEEMRRCGG